MSVPARVKTWSSGETVSASDLNTEFNIAINALTDGTAEVSFSTLACSGLATFSGNTIIGSNAVDTLVINATTTISSINVLKALVPIGSIIPFYDFDAALTFDTDYWCYCDGQSQTIGGSARTTPDLSGRYLVGFGGATDGAGDIDTAAWATAAVGNALHQVNLQHSHSHTHGVGSLQFSTLRVDASSGDVYAYASNGTETDIIENSLIESGVSDVATIIKNTGTYYTKDGTGSTASDATNGGSTTQSIQPRSIRVRFIMRKA